MQHTRRIGVTALTYLTLLFLGSNGAALGQAKPVPIIPKVVRDLEYGRVADVSLKLDLYLPGEERPELRPGIVFIHGGGWAGGDKKEFAQMAERMAGLGYVAISVNYRLAPKHRYPSALDDVQRAVRWLRQRAVEYRLDPNRIGALGASAGGHLAALLGLRETRDPASTGGVSSKVQCVVNYFGRMDLTLEPTVTKGFTDYRPAFIGAAKAEAPELYRDASPITHVDAKAAPFLIVHGFRDTQVQLAQSERMLAALDAAGVEASLIVLAGQGHGFKGPAAVTATEATVAFFERHLKP
jgi:acetyl esterase/lipase